MIEMLEMHGNNELGRLIPIPLFRGQPHRRLSRRRRDPIIA